MCVSHSPGSAPELRGSLWGPLRGSLRGPLRRSLRGPLRGPLWDEPHRGECQLPQLPPAATLPGSWARLLYAEAFDRQTDRRRGRDGGIGKEDVSRGPDRGPKS